MSFRLPAPLLLLLGALLPAILPGSAVVRVSAAGQPGGQTGAIAEDRQLGRLYVAQPASNVVFVLAASTMAVQVILKVPPSPVAMVVDEKSHHVYVAAEAAGVISVFDGRRDRLLRTIAVGGHPAGLALVDGGKTLLVTDTVNGAVQQIALAPTPGDPQQVFAAGSATVPVLVLAPPTAAAGQRSVSWSRGFVPGEPVTLYWGVQPLARMKADRAGIATARFTVPAGVALGPHLVIMMGQVSTRSVSTLLTVVRAPVIHKPRPYVPPPPSLASRLLKPRLVFIVPADLAVGPLHRLAGTYSRLSMPALVLEAVIALLCAILVFRSGRKRRRKALARKELKVPKGGQRSRRAVPAMNLKKAS